MYDLYEARNSIYCYENTDILKNKLNIKDKEKLYDYERKIVVAKLFILRQKEITGNFDIHHFVGIHKFLFEDIYDFAGLFRSENIAKGNFRFAEWEYIEQELIKLLDKLKEENYLQGLSKKELSKKLAYYMAELNVLHPFREGNGRAIREFIRELAAWNGYELDLTKTTPKNMLDACIESVVDTNNLEEILYKCYNTFYNPSNMAMVVCGDFEPEKLLQEIKNRLIDKKANGEIKRIYPNEPEDIVKEKIEQKMDVSQPLFVIGIKDKLADTKERVKKHIAIEILLNMILGKSSKLYKELYDEGLLFATPSLDYEYTRGYAHILITGQSPEPEKVYEKFKQTVSNMKIDSNEFNRIKKRIYGEYVKEYNDTADIARMFLSDFFKEMNSFDFLEEITVINEEYVEQVLKDVFNDKKMVISVIKKD